LVAADEERIPAILLSVLRLMLPQIDQLHTTSAAAEGKIMAVAKADPAMRRLATMLGVGGLTAHAIVTTIGGGKQFASSRDFAAGCGLTPRGASSGLKRRERGIGRQGDIRLRTLPALGAGSVIRTLARRPGNRMAPRHPCPPSGQGRGTGAGRQDRPHGAPCSDGKLVRTRIGTLRSVIAPEERAAMLGTRSA
jgi:hypothetical protein